MYKLEDIIKLIDLTTLNPTDTDDTVKELCLQTNTKYGNVAAICIYKEFMQIANDTLIKPQNIQKATVINFASGDNPLKSTLNELEYCLKNNATEIDLVLPYKQLINKNIQFVENYVKIIRKSCPITLKVIIESGELKNKDNIVLATKIAIDNGTNFVKTSTGKVPINATLEDSEIILKTIKKYNHKCGFKAAGGIKTYDDAIQYISLASEILGANYINPQTFRFGVSSLLTNLLNNTNLQSGY